MTAAHDTQTLAACPFCEGHARFVKHSAGMKATVGYDQWDAVACSRCGATVGACDRRFRNKDDAAKAWNLRAALASRLQEKEGQPALSEREAFEATVGVGRVLVKTPAGEYASPYVSNDWEVWQQARATLAAGSQAVQVPGWRLVPLAPTEAMLLAAAKLDTPALFKHGSTDPLPTDGIYMRQRVESIVSRAKTSYSAMVDAAPLQPLAGGEVQA